MSKVTDNIRGLLARIEKKALTCGRDPSTVRLVAVTKQVSTEEIREAFGAGQVIFGENYAQDLRDKSQALGDLPIEWHFIGHLQKNKAKYVVSTARCVQTIDGIEIATALSEQYKKRVGETSQKLECLIEVNAGGELSKSGVSPDDVPALAESVSKIENLKLTGLMSIPPFYNDPEKSRPHFRAMKDLLDRLNAEGKINSKLTELSMGMSGDFEVAIEEGATLLRIGTAIFGERI